MAPGPTNSRWSAAIAAALFAFVVVAYWASHLGGPPRGGSGATGAHGDAPSAAAGGSDSVDLSDAQLSAVKVEPVEERDFPRANDAVGSINFNEELSVQVFTPYAGRIIGLFASVGDDVKKGQTLFTIDSPDLLQAESTLIAAAGVLDLTTRNLARLKELYTTRAVSQRDLDQGTSDQQTAEGNLRGARRRAAVWQDRRGDQSHHCRAKGRPDARCAVFDRRPGHRAQCGAGTLRAAGKRAGAFHRDKY
jgi:membrane fusion protein, heavy metal efflux system